MPRRFGQHFLTNQNLLGRIADAAVSDPSIPIIEIGPGKGALTEHLLRRAPKVIAIEIDQVLVGYLQQRFRQAANLTVLNADVLSTDLAQWGRVTVAGNLPYYITSPIVEKVLALGPKLALGVFLVQKEVADRMASTPGGRSFGYLSVLVQTLSEPEILFDVPRKAFSPPPKVESAVIQLTPYAEPLTSDVESFLDFAQHCFRHKRKNLRNNLLPYFPRDVIDSLPEGKLRAEQLSVPALLALHERLTGVSSEQAPANP